MIFSNENNLLQDCHGLIKEKKEEKNGRKLYFMYSKKHAIYLMIKVRKAKL